MFDSLKKKFAEASGKLKNKVEDEAKEEDNIELIEESSQAFDDEETSKDIVDEETDEDDFEDEELSEDDFDAKLDDALESIEDEDSLKDSEEKSDEKEDSLEDDDSEDDSDDDSEENESKNRFLSFFKRDKKEKKDEDEIDEDLIEYIDDEEDLDEDESKDEGSIEELEAAEEESEDEESKVEEESEEESEEEKPKKSRRSLFGRKKDKDEDKESDEDDAKGTGGFLSFIREKTISEDDVEDILFELELGLLEADVAMDVSSVVVDSVKEDLVGQKIKRSSDIEKYTYNALKKAVYNIINIEGKTMTELLEEKVAQGEPLVVMLVGINGTGKTTTIGKLSNYYIKKGYTPVIAASDTFRAGAIEQVGYHADKLGVKLIKHEKGSDPAAVAFDAVQHAKAKGKELVLIDTAGRMQTNTNLMDEMKKIRRVSKPDLVVFVGDALTGNDATEQARKFNEAIDIDGVILTKADADSKGGAALSVGYIIKKPILFLGMGQSYDDIKEYDPDWMLDQIFG